LRQILAAEREMICYSSVKDSTETRINKYEVGHRKEARTAFSGAHQDHLIMCICILLDQKRSKAQTLGNKG
jgi:hypothetical protein